MADTRQSASAAGGAKGYKRSWKNLLINKRYQLRFTLFMVGVSALLMGILAVGEDLMFFTKWRSGERWWVMAVANDATEVASSGVRGTCGDVIPEMVLDPNKKVLAPMEGDDDEDVDEGDEAAPEGDEDPIDLSGEEGEGEPAAPDDEEATPVEPADAPADKPSAAPVRPEPGADPPIDPDADPDAGDHKVVVDDSEWITEPPPPMVKPLQINPMFLPMVAKHYECELRKAAKLDELERNRRRIQWVLLASCLGMVVALGIYGIKMTHKVAGPLYKVTLYMAKMRDGRLDKVYNLRKGDELVAFYEHFKDAHAGVVGMERADIDRLKAAIAAIDEHELDDKSPELKAAADELRAALARKEKSLE